MTIFRFDLETKNFYTAVARSGGSNKKKWYPLLAQIFLKDISFGVCECPFDPEKTSFRRKTFTPYTPKDYGIAIKGTQLDEEEYNSLMDDDKDKINPMIHRLFFRHGERFWQSYPNLIKSYKDKGLWEIAKSSPRKKGTYSLESMRKFPTWLDNRTNTDYYFQPSPIKAMRLTSQAHWQVFNEGATVRTWHDLHDTVSLDWRTTVNRRLTQALAA